MHAATPQRSVASKDCGRFRGFLVPKEVRKLGKEVEELEEDRVPKGIEGETEARGFKVAERKKAAEPAQQSAEKNPPLIKAHSFLSGIF